MRCGEAHFSGHSDERDVPGLRFPPDDSPLILLPPLPLFLTRRPFAVLLHSLHDLWLCNFALRGVTGRQVKQERRKEFRRADSNSLIDILLLHLPFASFSCSSFVCLSAHLHSSMLFFSSLIFSKPKINLPTKIVPLTETRDERTMMMRRWRIERGKSPDRFWCEIPDTKHRAPSSS